MPLQSPAQEMNTRQVGPSRSITLREALGRLVFVFALLPWVSFGTNSLDTQPWTLMACLGYLLNAPTISRSKTINAIVALLLIGLVIGLLLHLPNDFFLVARGIYGYMTLALTLLVICDVIHRYGVPLKVIVFINLLYLGFALLDTVAPGVSGAISASRTTTGRGVTSLAAEPSFLSIILFFLSWIYLVTRNYKIDRWTLLFLASNVFAIVVLAKSALGLVLLAMAMGGVLVYSLFRLQLRLLIGIGFGVALLLGLMPFFVDVLAGSRLMSIFEIFQSQSVWLFMLNDASVNVRVQSITFPILGAINRFFMPGGFETYGDAVELLRQQFSSFVVKRGGGNIISSWVGAMVYELGIFGLAVLVILCFSNLRRRIGVFFERMVLLAVCIHAIPINFPPIAILIVIFLRRKP